MDGYLPTHNLRSVFGGGYWGEGCLFRYTRQCNRKYNHFSSDPSHPARRDAIPGEGLSPWRIIRFAGLERGFGSGAIGWVWSS